MTEQNDGQSIIVRLTRNPAEVEAAQHLRYKVFYEEYGARATPEMAGLRRDFDEFDEVADHMVVLDTRLGPGVDGIVGTYRLLRKEIAERHGRFYTSAEYDIEPLLGAGASLLELGRSCVLAEYRTRPVLQKLWQGIADYVMDHRVGLLFGCASLCGTDIETLSPQLAYLHHYHLAPSALRPRALPDRYTDMNLHSKESLNIKEIFNDLPPLIKGYLRIGATIGDGAVIDRQFNTTDVCIVLPTELVTSRYRKHYERTTGKTVAETGHAPAPDLPPGDLPCDRERERA